MDPKQYKPFKLREQNQSVLSKNLGELQVELSSLRVNKVASGVASKLAKIKVVRKAIARTLTTLNQKKRQELKDMYKDKKALKTYINHVLLYFFNAASEEPFQKKFSTKKRGDTENTEKTHCCFEPC